MQHESNTPPAPTARRRYLSVFTAMLVLSALAAGGYFLRNAPIDYCYPEESEYPPSPVGDYPHEHTKWEKPLVAIVATGQMHGYFDPCGCTSPQYGGLRRRYNFVQSLTQPKKGWDVVGIDMGELPQIKGIHEQNLLKYELTINSLRLMNYRAIGIGRDEILLPLGDGLAKIWDAKKPHPRPLNVSLVGVAPGGNYHELNARPFEIISDTNPKIGVINAMGPDLRDSLKGVASFGNNMTEIAEALKEFAKAGVEVGIILQHEYPDVPANIMGIARMKAIEAERRRQALKCAEFCAAERKENPKVPEIQLMMLLTDEPEPPFKMSGLSEKLPTQVVEIGHKGKYVGLIGVYRAGKSYRLQYQAVLMSPDWETPAGKEGDNPVTKLMEQYNKDLKSQKILDKFARTLHYNQIQPANVKGLKSTFVGSDRCIDCHAEAGNVWKDQDPKLASHFRATETLENLKHPSGRQYDPECMMCHTTGMKHPGGYNDLVTKLSDWPLAGTPKAEKVKEHNESLRGVGCENCHGPGSEHVKNPNNADLYPLINPYRVVGRERELERKKEKQALPPVEQAEYQKLLSARLRPMSASLCMKCHDGENDVNWGQPGHEVFDKWIGKKLVHRSPTDPVAPKANVNIPPVVDNPPPIIIELAPPEKK